MRGDPMMLQEEWREHATILRGLARVMDEPGPRKRLLSLAEECEERTGALEPIPIEGRRTTSVSDRSP